MYVCYIAVAKCVKLDYLTSQTVISCTITRHFSNCIAFQPELILPAEIVSRIFGMVTHVKDKLRLGATCRQFQRVMMHKDSWRDPVIIKVVTGMYELEFNLLKLMYIVCERRICDQVWL